IVAYGQTANQMFQYMFAHVLGWRSGAQATIRGPALPEWGLAEGEGFEDAGVAVDLFGHVQPLDQLVGLLQCGQRVHVRIRGVSTRMAYYTPHLRAIRGLFQPVVPRAKG